MDKWILISEHVPPKCTPIWLSNQDTIWMGVCRLPKYDYVDVPACAGFHWDGFGWAYDSSIVGKHHNPTHWKPLPGLPEETP